MLTKFNAADPLGQYTQYQQGVNGFRLGRETESKAFLSWKVACVGCDRRWGQYEQFEYGDDRQHYKWDTIVPIVRHYLRDLGFLLLQSEAVLCPTCQGLEFAMTPMSEAVCDDLKYPWFTEAMGKYMELPR